MIAILIPKTTCSAQDVPTTQVDYVFLVDVSASMAGQAGHANIFPSVQATIRRFAAGLEDGTTLFVVPFAERIGELLPIVP